jgi:thiosulfate dehydrogenase (quinone) large subunit
MFTHHTPSTSLDHPELVSSPVRMMTSTATRALAVLRISTGFIFLWAFLDKTFGLRYSTPSAKAWIHGGSPTKGFLASVEVGPFQSLFHSIAGTWWANTLFMLGLLGVGVAVIAGVALRAAAVAGVILVAGMWLAEFPLAQHTSAGAPSGSSNPIVDYHFLYAVALIVVALTYAGSTWGLGKVWARLPFVHRHPWAL